jgi:hypothetical protein
MIIMFGCAQELITWQWEREDGRDLLCLGMNSERLCAMCVRNAVEDDFISEWLCFPTN